MLIPLLIDHPEAIVGVVRHTPVWVGGVLAALVVLGLSQARERSASLARVAVMPIVMGGFAIWGLAGAFGQSPMFGYAMMAWMLVAALTFAAVAMTSAPKGTRYDPDTRTFTLPGSWVPLALIAGIFIVRYVVNVDIAMQPSLTRDGMYTLIVAAIYGSTTGLFAGRAARLWRMASERASFGAVLQRDPW